MHALIFVGLFLASAARAETIDSERIVVTATRIAKPQDEVGSSVTVIPEKELQRQKKNELRELLEGAPGLTVFNNGGTGQSATLSIRGASSEHTLFLLDGIELNDALAPSRNFDMAHFSLADVERVEILRGPQSVLYGSDALGGVVQIFTKRGHGPWNGRMRAAAGSYGNRAAAFSLGTGREAWHFQSGLDFSTASGFSAADRHLLGNREADGYRRLTHNLRMGRSFGDRIELEWISRAVASRLENDAFGGAFGDDPAAISRVRQLFSRLKLRSLSRDEKWDWSLAANGHAQERQNFPIADRYKSILGKLEALGSWRPSDSLVSTIGVEGKREQGTAPGVAGSVHAAHRAIFLQALWNMGADLTAGIRHDHHDRFGSAVTARSALSKTLGAFRPHASLGNAFRAPSLYQLYAVPYGTPTLRSERSVGWDAGAEWRRPQGLWAADLTYFANRFRDLINFDSNSRYSNISVARTSGVESTLRFMPSARTEADLSHTWMRSRAEPGGAALLRRPRHSAQAKWRQSISDTFRAVGSWVWKGVRDDMDSAGSRVRMPSYQLFHLQLDWEWREGQQLFAEVRNIANRRYQEVRGYGTEGRAIYVGAEARF